HPPGRRPGDSQRGRKAIRPLRGRRPPRIRLGRRSGLPGGADEGVGGVSEPSAHLPDRAHVLRGRGGRTGKPAGRNRAPPRAITRRCPNEAMFQVGNPRRYGRLPPVQKLVALVFAMVGKDRATWLRFDHYPTDDYTRMWSFPGGEVLEMVPPPAHLWPDLL